KMSRDLDEEIRAHVELMAEEKMAKGMKPDEARRESRMEAGGIEQVKENVRSNRAGAWLDVLAQDVRFGIRVLIKNPGFTLVAVLALALGIGANTAMFSIVNSVLLRPLPYAQPERLVKLWTRFTNIGLPDDQNWISAPEFRDITELNKSLSDLAAFTNVNFNITTSGTANRVLGAQVSPGFFAILGVNAERGRVFAKEEGEKGHDTVLLLSHGLWERRFGADPGITGKQIIANGQSFTVVGVLPAGFDYPNQSEMWSPLSFAPSDLTPDNRGNHQYEMIGRLKPGVAFGQARADLDLVGREMTQQHGEYPYAKFDFTVTAMPLIQDIAGDVKQPLWILMTAVALVLLIACANLAGLLLVRATSREREIAIRIALGAGGRRIVRQLITESLLLSLLGGVIGMILAPIALRMLEQSNAVALPRVVGTQIDLPVLLFTTALSLATGVLFGILPALQVIRDVNCTALREGGRSQTVGASSRRLRRLLVTGETAIALILLVSAGLLFKSFVRVLEVNPGFRADGVLKMTTALPPEKYATDEQVAAFFRQALERIKQLPGVDSAGFLDTIPLGDGNESGTVTVDTQSVPLDRTAFEADQRAVTPGLFKTLGIPLLRGRDFSEGDTATTTPVAVIDETMAELYWPGQDPIGKRVHRGGGGSKSPWRTIVGEVGHVRYRTLEARSRTELYMPEEQVAASTMSILVHTSGDPLALASSVEKAIQAIDPDQPVYRVRTMTQVMAESVARRKLGATLLGVFAGLALLLSVLGIYGVIAFDAAQRTNEIGIRVALGAQRISIIQLMLSDGLRPVLIGIVTGLVGGAICGRLIRSMLFDARPLDGFVLISVALVMAAVASVACLFPAWRAARLDPMNALRYE
ncbi:MAG: ABC transporter permease, partial [Candidatus Acidiferrales bacterium]